MTKAALEMLAKNLVIELSQYRYNRKYNCSWCNTYGKNA